MRNQDDYGIINRSFFLAMNILTRTREHILKHISEYVFGGFMLFLVIFNAPVIRDVLPQGWDTPPHYYLFENMIENIRNGYIARYNPKLFGGYPEFYFYSPLPYIIGAILYFLSFGLFSPEIVFNFMLFCIPLILAGSIWYCIQKITSHTIIKIIGVCCMFLWLASPEHEGHLGIGIYSIFFNGLFNNALGLSLLSLMTAKLLCFTKHPKYQNTLIVGVLFGSLILTHLLSSVFGIFLLFIFCITHTQYITRILLSVCTGLLLASPWLWNFARYYEYSMGEKVGKIMNDPLFVLFPDLNVSLKFFLEMQGSVIGALSLGLLFAIGVTSALIHQYKTSFRFIILTYIAGLILLPRDYLFFSIDAPFHYYRFVSHISLLQIFIVLIGFEHLVTKKFSQDFYTKIYRISSVSALSLLIILQLITPAWNNLEGHRRFLRTDITKAADGSDAEETIAYLQTLPVDGKILAESSPIFNDFLGSVHYFNTMIPLKTNHQILSGLLAESTLSHHFVTPIFGKITHTLQWGKNPYKSPDFFSNMGPEDIFAHLKMYDVKYVILASQIAHHNAGKLIAENQLKHLESFGHIGVFEVIDPTPTASTLYTKPFFFIEDGGMNFMAFSEVWYKDSRMLDFPVLGATHTKDYDSLLVYAGGLIISSDKKSYSKQDLERINSHNLPVIILNGASNIDEVLEYNHFDSRSDLGSIVDFMSQHTQKREETAASITYDNPYQVSTDCEGMCILRYNFFPHIKETSNNTDLFSVTPSHIFYLGDGENIFEFH
jgi:hypothetical protein